MTTLAEIWNAYKVKQMTKVRSLRDRNRNYFSTRDWKVYMSYVQNFVEQYPTDEDIDVDGYYMTLFKAINSYQIEVQFDNRTKLNAYTNQFYGVKGSDLEELTEQEEITYGKIYEENKEISRKEKEEKNRKENNRKKEFIQDALFMCLTWAKNNLLLENDVFKEVLFSKEEKLFWQQTTRITCHWSKALNKRREDSKLIVDIGRVFSTPPTQEMLGENGYFNFETRNGVSYVKADGTTGTFAGLIKIKYDKTYVACYFLYHFNTLFNLVKIEDIVPIVQDAKEQIDSLEPEKDELGNPVVRGELLAYIKSLDSQMEVEGGIGLREGMRKNRKTDLHHIL